MKLPKAALGVLREVGRHILRRPVVGIAAVARDAEGRFLLVRRADTGTWAPPGGTLEWGETLSATLPREIREEAGVDVVRDVKLLGVYSRPDRDLRFHAVTILAGCRIEGPIRGPKNVLEIREARLFRYEDIPWPMAMDMDDMFKAAARGESGILE